MCILGDVKTKYNLVPYKIANSYPSVRKFSTISFLSSKNCNYYYYYYYYCAC